MKDVYDTTVTDADDYAELFDAEVRRVLDIHAPLRTGRRRCGQHDIRQLSDEARHAKQVAWSIDIGELVSSRIDERTCRRAQLRATV